MQIKLKAYLIGLMGKQEGIILYNPFLTIPFLIKNP